MNYKHIYYIYIYIYIYIYESNSYQVCEKPIGNQSFIPRDMDVVCVPCYEEKYAQKCAKCTGVSFSDVIQF